jgi:hypothetical protein
LGSIIRLAAFPGCSDRARADAQKTPSEFFGNMPVDRKIEDRSLRRDRREVAGEATHRLPLVRSISAYSGRTPLARTASIRAHDSSGPE